MLNLLLESAHFTVHQASGYRIPGYLIVESKADVTRLADFEPAAAAELMQLLVSAETVVEELTGAERVYVMKFAELNPRVHFHIVPRTARIGAAFAAATGAVAPFNGAALVAWLWDQHAELGFTDSELESSTVAARTKLEAKRP